MVIFHFFAREIDIAQGFKKNEQYNVYKNGTDIVTKRSHDTIVQILSY